MDSASFVIFFFIILIPLVLGIIIPAYKKHSKITGNVVNYDAGMRRFVYKTYLSENEILKALQIVNASDELKCDLNTEQSTVLFSEYGASVSYTFEIKEFDDFSVFKLNQNSLIATSGYIPYKLNPFIAEKLNAEIIPFAEYEK